MQALCRCNMDFKTDYKLEDYILNTRWEDIPVDVQHRLRGCLVDLIGALIAGSVSSQFKVGLALAEGLYGKGDIAVVGSDKRFNFMGAATAMGHSSNAFDIDDGHNIIRAHPGTSFIGPILACAYEKNTSLKELFCALLVAYESTIRWGVAVMEYYKYAHSSGTFGAFGTVAGVGRIWGFTREQLNNAFSVADFNAPLVPGIRSVEYPSMNKDGVPFGVMVGILAVAETMCGFEGNKNLLESDEYRYLVSDLGENYEIMKLYFKPYPCCRWGHSAIDSCLSVIRDNNIVADNIERVVVKTFERATMLSKIEPKTVDEAQYNVAYPVAAAIVNGDFTLREVLSENLGDKRVLEMMKRLSFEKDDRLDSLFPAKRICRAEIYTNDGKCFVSDECEPRGEAHENIDINWLSDKFLRITAPVISREKQNEILSLILGDISVPVRTLVDTINE